MNKQTVLVTGGTSGIGLSVAIYLRHKGYKVYASSRNPDRYDLIYTDQTMPNLSGAELSQEVLKIRPNMPIILCTGYSSVISQQQALAMGIKKYVNKPISKEELAEVVKNVLEENASHMENIPYFLAQTG